MYKENKIVNSEDIEVIYKYLDDMFLFSLKYPLSPCYIDELKAITFCLNILDLLPDGVSKRDILDCL